jgi:hypothetical protein
VHAHVFFFFGSLKVIRLLSCMHYLVEPKAQTDGKNVGNPHILLHRLSRVTW